MSGALNFPSSPVKGQTFLSGGVFLIYDGERWLPAEAPRGQGIPVFRNGRVYSEATTTRTETYSSAVLAANGEYIEYVSNQPRIDANNYLVVEDTRTNGIRNPRGNFTVAPTFPQTTNPTNWSIFAAAGLTYTWQSRTQENGIDVLRVRITGTATATATTFSFDTTTGVTAATNTTYTGSVFFRQVAANTGTGSLTYRTVIQGRTSGGAISESLVQTFTPSTTTLQRVTQTLAFTDPTTARACLVINCLLTNAGTYDFTYDVGWPQLEQGEFASTPILNSPSQTGTAPTRNRDLLTLDFSTAFPSGDGTVIWRGTIDQSAGTTNTLFQISDGTDNNGIAIYNDTGTRLILAGISGGVSTLVNLGNITFGTPFSVSVHFQSNGTFVGVLDGVPSAVGSGASLSSATQLRLGTRVATDTGMFGTVQSFETLPEYNGPDVGNRLTPNAGLIAQPGTEYNPATQPVPFDYQPAAMNAVTFLGGLKNRVINGNFAIHQRTGSVTATSGFAADRWEVKAVNGSRTVQRVALTNSDQTLIDNTESRWCVQYAATGGTAATDYETLIHRIEGVHNFANGFATASFWARRTAGSGNMTTEFFQSFGSGGSATVNAIQPVVHTLTTTWTKYVYRAFIPSIAGKTIGTDLNDQFTLHFWLSAGTNWATRSASLGVQTVTVQIADVQVEAGLVPTEFERRPISFEILLCQRYCTVLQHSMANATSGTQGRQGFTFNMPMRATPSNSVLSAGTITNATVNTEAATSALGGYFGMTASVNGGSVYDRQIIYSAELT